MRLSIKLMTALGLAAAFALGAAVPSFARSAHIASPHKVRADANGYFFFPANYFDDSYVYSPRATPHRTTSRAKSHRSRR